MKHRIATLIAVSGTIIAVATGHALAQRKAPTVQQGLWEITVAVTDVSNLVKPPGAKFPSKAFQACLTKAQADDPVTFITMNVAPMGPECRPGMLRQTGNRASWPVECPATKSGPSGSGSNAFEFTPTAFEGTARQSRPMTPEKSVDMTMSVSGKRVSDC